MSFFLRLNEPALPSDDSLTPRRDRPAERDWHESSWELQKGLEVNEFFDTMPLELADLAWPLPEAEPPRG